jgi:AcrR family transcriptional regulator
MKRAYHLNRRATSQNETRQRIIEATVHLHQLLGPTKTTISAIANRAGVERLTVYRHFPDDKTLFSACTSHYLSLNPPPDPTRWMAIIDPAERLRTGLNEIYAYHHLTEPMFTQSASALEEIPVLREVLRPFFEYWGRVQEILCSPWETTALANPQVRVIVSHAIKFQTWRSLVKEHHLSNVQTVDLWMSVVGCLSSLRTSTQGRGNTLAVSIDET